MSGELTQIAATGVQDSYLTEKPEITLWKGSYKRHTNFSIGNFEQTYAGSLGYNKKLDVTIPRNGDLVHQIYAVFEFSALQHPSASVRTDPSSPYVPADGSVFSPYHLSFCNSIGHAIIDYIEVSIGGHRFDRVYGDYLNIWENIARSANKDLKEVIGYGATPVDLDNYRMRSQRLYVPIGLWFTMYREKALPLIALQYHDVKLTVSLKDKSKLILLGSTIDPAVTPGAQAYTGGDLSNAYTLINFVFLEGGERKLFAQNQHEYLIEQLQFNGAESKQAGKTQFNINLNFNHPVKELIWVLQQQDKIDSFDYFNYEGAPDFSNGAITDFTNTYDPLISAKLQLNGHDRFQHTPGHYFRQIVPFETHSRIPNSYIYLYSFATDPEKWEPSGSCNFSRIDTVTLQLTTQNFAGEIRVYARSLNVMKIVSGMAGLKYAN